MVNSYKISDNKILSPALLAEYIAFHDRQILERYRKLGKAYETKFDLGKRPPKEKWKPNNILKAGFPRYLTDTYNGFFCGIVPTISSVDDRINGNVQYILDYTDLPDLISEISKTTSIYGRAYLMSYVDRVGEIGAAVTTPLTSFIIEDEGIVPDARYFVHIYVDSNNIRRGSFSDGSYIQYFVVDPDVRFIDDPVPHGFDGVPAVEFTENSEKLGLYEGQMSLIIGYSKALSYELDDVESFASAILKVLGAKLSGDEMRALRENQIINFEGSFSGGDLVVDFLQKPDGNQTQENLLTRLEKLIFTLSMVCNITDESFGTSSGIALKYKLLAMYNLAATKERKFRIALRRFWKLVCSNPVSPFKKTDYMDIDVTFFRNLPSNLAEEVQIAGQLGGITSKDTQLSVLSIVPDVQAEKEKMREEEKEDLSLGYPTDRIAEEDE